MFEDKVDQLLEKSAHILEIEANKLEYAAQSILAALHAGEKPRVMHHLVQLKKAVDRVNEHYIGLEFLLP